PCGTGWGTSLLKGAARITGIDVSEEAITYAQEHYERSDRRFVTGAMESIPLPENDVEVLICLEGFEHVTETFGTQFIEEAKRVLIDGGVLIMTCPVLNECGETTSNPYHFCEYDERKLIVILNDNFRIQRLERIQGPDGPEYRAVLINVKKGCAE
ncbi:MAG: class I SAM-dependent methyltransferase, partial [bacterium]|nr:class I SAM-dependent methyltransferase [bacterium]